MYSCTDISLKASRINMVEFTNIVAPGKGVQDWPFHLDLYYWPVSFRILKMI